MVDRVDAEGYTDDCSGHPLPAPPAAAPPPRADPRPAVAASGAARNRRLLLVALPTVAVLVAAGAVTTRLLLRGSAEAHPVSVGPAGTRRTAPVAPDDPPPAVAPLTEEAVRAAAALLTLDAIHEGDPPSAVISGQEVDPGSIIHVEGDPPVDFRVDAIEPALVRLVVDAIDPPLEIELVQPK